MVGGRQTRRPLLPSFLVLAHLLRAACLSHFARANEAIGACDEALKIAPNDDVVLQMRSLIQAGSSDGSFQAAVRNALNRFKMSAWKGATLSAA